MALLKEWHKIAYNEKAINEACEEFIIEIKEETKNIR